MAGENTTYNDISSGKVVNKEGLLELCGQIKTAIASAGSGSGGASYTAGNGVEIDANNVISTNDLVLPDFLAPNVSWGPSDYADMAVSLSEDFITSLNDLVFNYNLDVLKKRWQISHGAYIVKLTSRPLNAWYNGSVAQNYNLLKKKTKLIITDIYTYKNYIYEIDLFNVYNFDQDWNGNWIYNHSTHTLSQNSGSIVWALKSTNNVEAYETSSTIRNNLSGKDVVYGRHYNNAVSISPAYFTLSTVGQTGSYNDLTDKPTIPSLPTDPSSDGIYVLQNTISSGTPTLSWGTPSSGGGGGGTTYTAGTGISITNGVISLDLQNANGVSY